MGLGKAFEGMIHDQVHGDDVLLTTACLPSILLVQNARIAQWKSDYASSLRKYLQETTPMVDAGNACFPTTSPCKAYLMLLRFREELVSDQQHELPEVPYLLFRTIEVNLSRVIEAGKRVSTLSRGFAAEGVIGSISTDEVANSRCRGEQSPKLNNSSSDQS